MCEYCGCQAITAIAELTGEHDMVVAMIGEARAAICRPDPDYAAAVARRIAVVLGPHTQVEEHGLFPALVDDFGSKVAILEAEHRHVEAVLGEAATGTPVDPTWPDRLLEALHLLREHILKEQDGVFPAALSCLSPADWDRIDEIRACVRPATRDDEGLSGGAAAAAEPQPLDARGQPRESTVTTIDSMLAADDSL